jgi:uncharacterized protein YcaQ
MRSLSNDQARRITLAAQGFSDPVPNGRVDVRHFRRVLERMGLLQLDSVNVLVRSHYLPVFSRLGPYDTAALDRWTVRSGELFEYWGHVASLLPIHTYPLFRHRMEEMGPWRRVEKLQAERPGYVEAVLRQVGERGPLTVADLDDPGERTGPWWGNGPGKTALECLFARGEVAAYRNGTFGRIYDVPERVIPEPARTAPAPDREDAYRELLVAAARQHGVGTAGDLIDYYRLHGPTARPILVELAAEGRLSEVEVRGWEATAYLHPEAGLPRRARGTALPSPFDPLVWERDRVERIFGFRYRIEIYVPEPKREYGYYVLPLLVDGDLVGRVDLKADRKAGRLLARASWVEDGRDPEWVAEAMAGELVKMASWLGLDEVAVENRGNLARFLRRRM